MSQRATFNYRSILISLCAVFALINLLIVCADHYYFRTVNFDYGVYNFAFFDYAHFRISPCPVYLWPDMTFLQDHFSLTLMVLSPFYWLLGWLTGTYTLQILQWLFIVGGAWATYKLLVLKTGDRVLATLAFLFYFVQFGRFTACDADCNLAIIGSAMVPVFLYFFEAKKTAAMLISFLFLVINREDYTLWLFFICIYLLISHRKDVMQRRRALMLLGLTVICFLIIFKWIIPSIETPGHPFQFFQFGILGNTPGEAMLYILKHPLRAIELLFVNHSGEAVNDSVKFDFYLIYLLSGGVVLLFRPLYLIPFIPLLAKKMYTDAFYRWSTISYYSVEFVSIFPLFVFLVLADLKKPDARYAMASLVCAVTMLVSYYKIELFWYSPHLGDAYKHNFFVPSFYTSDYNVPETYRALAMIPPDAAVSASGRATPHLALREKVYFFPHVADAEYIFLFRHADTYPLNKEDFNKETQKFLADPAWKVAYVNDDVLLLKHASKD